MKKTAIVIRWIARLLSVAMIGLVVAYAIDLGSLNPAGLIPELRGGYISLLVMTAAGLFAWWWELPGGLIILAGFAAYWYFEGNWLSSFFAAFPLSGLLYLIAWMLEHPPKPAPAVDPNSANSNGKGKARTRSKGKGRREKKKA